MLAQKPIIMLNNQFLKIHEMVSRMDAQRPSGADAKKDGLPPARKGKKSKVHYNPVIFHAWCKSCGICIEFCPKKVIGKDDMGAPLVERPDDCIGCRFCELHCPDFAITIKERKGEGDAL
jgi:2-oxoglutarate ferredoxin oxidoreductase subunit delta